MKRLRCWLTGHFFTHVKRKGCWDYYQCLRCGARDVALGPYDPIDTGWLRTGHWTPEPARPDPLRLIGERP